MSDDNHDSTRRHVAQDETLERFCSLAAQVFDIPLAVIKMVANSGPAPQACSCADADAQQSASVLPAQLHRTIVLKDTLGCRSRLGSSLASLQKPVRFYAGAPIRGRDGSCLGALSIMDYRPRSFAGKHKADLQALANCLAHVFQMTHDAPVQDTLKTDDGAALHQSDLLSLVAIRTLNAVVITDEAGLIEWVNPSFLRITGYTLEEVIGRSPGSFLHGPETDPEVVRYMRRQLRAGQGFRTDILNYGKGGRRYWIDMQVQPVCDADHRIRHYISIQADITERKQAEISTEHRARHDAVTGLPGRELFMDRLNLAITQARRSNMVLGILIFDLDRFKIVNDSMGHACGDELLKDIAQRLTVALRATDIVARMNGDEFYVILPTIREAADMNRVAEKIVETLRPPFEVNGQEIFVTVSLGGSVFPTDGEESEQLIKHAEIAMYRAKHSGRNSFRRFARNMNQRAAERLTLETNLHKAVANNEFRVYYQPQISLLTGRIIGAEALVRWQHPERGVVGPGEFIPLAEETGLISDIGYNVLQQACRQAHEWHRQGNSTLRIAVNVSKRQFQTPDIIGRIAAVMRTTGLDPALLELEMTENAAIEQFDAQLAILQELKSLGLTLALDDFGTGYSSLNYLTRLPIDTLKIDRSFIQGTNSDNRDAAIVTSIIQMAHNLMMTVVAEGVERPNQATFLHRQGCDAVQGFLYNRPVPVEQFTHMLDLQRALTMAA